MRKTFLISTLCLVSYGIDNKTAFYKEELTNKYLACYALGKAAKKECTDKLAAKYIPTVLQNDKEYKEEFQFEAEKNSFKRFLNNHQLPYRSIEDGPIFQDAQKAYKVICKPSGTYFIQFNYENKEWKLLEKDYNDK